MNEKQILTSNSLFCNCNSSKITSGQSYKKHWYCITYISQWSKSSRGKKISAIKPTEKIGKRQARRNIRSKFLYERCANRIFCKDLKCTSFEHIPIISWPIWETCNGIVQPCDVELTLHRSTNVTSFISGVSEGIYEDNCGVASWYLIRTSKWLSLTSINEITIHFVNMNKWMNNMLNTNCIMIGVCIIESKNPYK